MDMDISIKNLSNHQSITADTLDGLLIHEFRPKNEFMANMVREAVRILACQAQENQAMINEDVIKTIHAIIAKLDSLLTNQINEIIHHPDFQKLESSWRGLEYLLKNSKLSDKLKVKVMNVEKVELHRNFRGYEGDLWDQSPLFKKIYEEEFGQFGGEPFGCIITDYEFDHSNSDIELLGSLAQIAASAHCPFIGAASPAIMQMEKWTELSNPREINNIFSTPDFIGWRNLRQSPDSRYICLTLPRFASRVPYGRMGDRIDNFNFEESLLRGPEDVLWSNAAFAMGVNIANAFSQYGWCSKIRGIESGGVVSGLPTLRFVNDQNNNIFGIPTETAISDRREAELSRAGFMPLVYRKNSDLAAFIGARSIHKPKLYDDADSNSNAELSTRLPYVLATSRFAHYLKCIARDKVGSLKNREAIQRWLNDWIMSYVDGDPSISSEEIKAKRPLADAQVIVEDILGEPGLYATTFYLLPHYQLEGLTISLRLVGKIPANTGA